LHVCKRRKSAGFELTDLGQQTARSRFTNDLALAQHDDVRTIYLRDIRQLGRNAFSTRLSKQNATSGGRYCMKNASCVFQLIIPCAAR
jgi:hypothetical protein